jgi:2C-methyl-D-erythritol 2,4-cyclodiphosphate synthase
MTDDDLKAIVAKYQQKSFELFNSNIVLETQIEKLNITILSLTKEIEDLKKTKRSTKSTGDFD